MSHFAPLAHRAAATLDGIRRRSPPLWLLILLCAALWGGEFARRGLWEPDEARYAYVAQEMHEGGHWFAPHILGEPYPDKPPLLFWLINASSLLTGGRINGISARLPSLLGSILTLWVVAQLMARRHSVRAAWRSVIVLMTSYMFWHEGGWGRTDALLCGLIMMSVHFLITSRDKSTCSQRISREAIGYLFAGLAVLTKGPIGLVLPMGIYACISIVNRDADRPGRLHWFWGPPIALLLPAIWLALARLEGAPKDYFISMFTEKSFSRIAHSPGHARSTFFFLWHFPAEFLPWTVFLPAALTTISYRAVKRQLLAWFCFVIVLFSLFTCKRNIYILAAYPAAAMLIGAAWDDFSRLSRRGTLATGAAAIGLVCLLGLTEAVAVLVPGTPIARWTLIPPACLMIPGAALSTAIFRRERFSNRWFAVFAGLLFVHQAAISLFVYPALNDMKAPVEFGREAAARLAPGQPVYIFQDQLAIFPLYAERPGRRIDTLKQLKKVMSDKRGAIVVFNGGNEKHIPDAPGISVDMHQVEMGHKRLVWAHFQGTVKSSMKASQLR